MQVKKQQFKKTQKQKQNNKKEATVITGLEQQTGSKLGKEYIKAVYMQSTSCKMLGWVKHKLESRLLGEITITSDMQMTPPLCQKAKKN